MKRMLPCETTWRSTRRLGRLWDRIWNGHTEHSCVLWFDRGHEEKHTWHVCLCRASFGQPRHAVVHETIGDRVDRLMVGLELVARYHTWPVANPVVLGFDGSRAEGAVVAAHAEGVFWVDETHLWSDGWWKRIPVDDLEGLDWAESQPGRRLWLNGLTHSAPEALSASVSDRNRRGRQGPVEAPERPGGVQAARNQQGSSENADSICRHDRTYAGCPTCSFDALLIGSSFTDLDHEGCDVRHDVHQMRTLKVWHEEIGTPPTCRHFPIEAEIEPAQEPASPVVDLVAALRESVDAARARRLAGQATPEEA